ncbi:hypothetical protein ACTG9Q_24675 [Actinokineospora sp. 24-640]
MDEFGPLDLRQSGSEQRGIYFNSVLTMNLAPGMLASVSIFL